MTTAGLPRQVSERITRPCANECEKNEENSRLDGNCHRREQLMTAAKERQTAEAHAKIDGTESRINKPGHIFLLNAQNQVEKQYKGKKNRSQKGFQRIKTGCQYHDGSGNGCGFQIDVDTEMFQHLIIFKKGQQGDEENGSRQKPASQIYQPKDSDDTDDRCDHTHFHFLSSVSPPKRRSLPVNQSIAFESSSSVKSGHRTGVKYSSP